MSAETISSVSGPRSNAARSSSGRLRPAAGALADGTPFYAPIGRVVVDDSLVTCHLCGRARRSVGRTIRFLASPRASVSITNVVDQRGEP